MHASPIPSRPYREVHPYRRAALLQDQLIEVLLLLIRDVQQDTRIPDRLRLIFTPYIHRASRQMIAIRRPSTQPIHLLRPESAVNNDGFFFG